MSDSATTRRAFLGSTAAATAAALAGCTAPSRDSATRYEQWTPASAASDQFREMWYGEPAALHRRSVAQRTTDGRRALGWAAADDDQYFDFYGEASAHERAPTDIDWYYHVGGTGPPQVVVAEGTFDTSAVADALTAESWERVDAPGDYTGFRPDESRVIAASEDRMLDAVVSRDESPVALVEDALAASRGTDRYADEEPAFELLCDAVGDVPYAHLSTVTDPFPENRPREGLFEGLVTRGAGVTVSDGTATTRFVAVFDADASIPERAIEGWAADLPRYRTRHVEVSGRVVEVVASGPVVDLPQSAYAWPGISRLRA